MPEPVLKWKTIKGSPSWTGSARDIPELMRSSHLLFSAEINPPCPNSVIEALACGLPVVGFDTGSLRELIGDNAGRLAPYGGNPWKLEPPDVPALAKAAVEVLENQERFR